MHIGVLGRIEREGFTRRQAEMILLVADGASRPEIEKALGVELQADWEEIKAKAGTRRQIKALVKALWDTLQWEQFYEEEEL